MGCLSLTYQEPKSSLRIIYKNESPRLLEEKPSFFQGVLEKKVCAKKKCSSSYRYGFNGKELDPEGMGGGGSTYDYGFRIYNPQIAKFLSVDPLTKSYPWYTPYQFAGNAPIWAIDIDGLEEFIVVHWTDNEKLVHTTMLKVPDNLKVDKESNEIVYLTLDAAAYDSEIQQGIMDVSAYKREGALNKFINDNLSKDKGAWEAQFRQDEQAMVEEGFENVDPNYANAWNNNDNFRILNIHEPVPDEVEFESGSSELTDKGKSELNKQVLKMALLPNSTFNLEGHTDSDGNDTKNLQLGQDRADAAKAYVVSQGISEGRLTTSSKGELSPVVPNTNEDGSSNSDGKSKNRRIEFQRTDKND